MQLRVAAQWLGEIFVDAGARRNEVRSDPVLVKQPEPVVCHRHKNHSLVGDGGIEHEVEDADTVGANDQQEAIIQPVCVANFTAMDVLKPWK